MACETFLSIRDVNNYDFKSIVKTTINNYDFKTILKMTDMVRKWWIMEINKCNRTTVNNSNFAINVGIEPYEPTMIGV